jgi:hypothetical protein
LISINVRGKSFLSKNFKFQKNKNDSHAPGSKHQIMWIMEEARPVAMFIEPTDLNVPKELRPERRRGSKERRKLHTYIYDDRRSGIADRRKRTG